MLRATHYVPDAVTWPEDGEIVHAVSVKITSYGLVSKSSPLLSDPAIVRGSKDVPNASTRTKDSKVMTTIAIKVTIHGLVPIESPLLSNPGAV